MSSVTAVGAVPSSPVYVATKFGVNGLTLSWGSPEHYSRTKVRVIGICPGVTTTRLAKEAPNKSLGPEYAKVRHILLSLPEQK